MRYVICGSRTAGAAGILLCVLLLATVTSCKKKVAPPPPPPPPPMEKPAPPPPPERVEEAPPKPFVEHREEETDLDDTMRRQNAGKEFLKTVYFEFDKSEIGDDQVPTLQKNAAWLKANPGFKVLIEGHCDERGTIEYNLALGDRRAKHVRQYLADLGLAEDRVRTISYGKERPADPGHDEEAWGKNRRAEFILEK